MRPDITTDKGVSEDARHNAAVARFDHYLSKWGLEEEGREFYASEADKCYVEENVNFADDYKDCVLAWEAEHGEYPGAGMFFRTMIRTVIFAIGSAIVLAFLSGNM